MLTHPLARNASIALALTFVLASLGVPTATAAAPNASDSFGRSVSVGWGSADSGGAWNPCKGTCAASFSVASGIGQVSVGAGKGPEAYLDSVSSLDTDTAVTASVDRAATGGGTFLALVARGTYGAGYRGKARIRPDGGVDLSIVRTTMSVDTALATATMPAGSLTEGTSLRLRMQAVGASPTQLKLRAWKTGSTEPMTWNVVSSDTTAALQAPGSVGVWTYVSGTATNAPAVVSFDDFTAAPTVTAAAPTPTPTPTPTPAPSAGTIGARLPVTYSLSGLGGTVRYVSPSGSDTGGTGSLAAPFRTLVKAESVSANGDSIVVRGGTYPISGNSVYVDRTGVTIVAYPGEVPVFDGSVAAPQTASTEGTLRFFSYQPIPAGLGEGLVLAHLPKATFSGSSPTGLAAQRGWRCVSGSTYSTPSPTTSDPDGCSTAAHVVTGLYPDQVWVNGTPLQQVSDKSRVTAGTFWLPRTPATDAAPGLANLYLSATDAADLSKVRVSSSKGTFIQIAADRVRLEGLQIQRHSPGGSHYAVVVGQGVDDFVMRDVRFDSNAGSSFKLAGGASATGSQLIRRTSIDHVSVTRAGFMGSPMLNTDDTTVNGTLYQNINSQKEFLRGPVSGAIKAMTTHRTTVRDSLVENVWGHGLWFDQSNYDATVAHNRFLNNSHSAVFFEVSHGLTMVNNYIKAPSIGAGEEGHSNVRLAGASGVKIVNNTILGGPVGIGIYTDLRSKKYDSNGDGTPDRWCSEHTVRYGQGGDSKAACNSPYTTDFDTARAGAYSPTGAPNLTPGLTWQPTTSMIINNIIANQSGKMAEGWTPCGGNTPLCAFGYVTSPAVDVSLASVFPKGSIINGNVYQTAGPQIAWTNSRAQTAATGAFKAATLAALKGTAGFGSSFYGLSVEANGLSGPGWVNPDGSPTAQLTSKAGQAAPVPTDAKVNAHIPAGSRSYGYRG